MSFGSGFGGFGSTNNNSNTGFGASGFGGSTTNTGKSRAVYISFPSLAVGRDMAQPSSSSHTSTRA
ncbi:unnamed protein product [Aureobasidium pullulans]|nr:unnamed protein product [Aureobasidium pullulans]CAD0044319.1 unnamed protein product [Aureobasidium pullulans]CAD0057469.1 unnamed protein product [Aureobasidium pullulans]